MPIKLTGVALAVAMLTMPLAANAQVSVGIRVGPPPLRYERVPPPRRGYVWAPGRWHWQNTRYVWNAGRYIPARPGYRWVPGAWGQRNASWHYVPGHWVR